MPFTEGFYIVAAVANVLLCLRRVVIGFVVAVALICSGAAWLVLAR